MHVVPFTRPASFAQRWCWLLPAVAVGGASERSFSVVVVSCTVTAVIWQLVYRRDLADRLTRLAVMYVTVAAFAVGFAMLADTGVSMRGSDANVLAGLVQVILTLVIVEQMLRLRDLRLLRRSPRPAGVEPRLAQDEVRRGG